jgi:hypothetical protein
VNWNPIFNVMSGYKSGGSQWTGKKQ